MRAPATAANCNVKKIANNAFFSMAVSSPLWEISKRFSR
jgi:hypothetical protein